jgi:cytochrome P450
MNSLEVGMSMPVGPLPQPFDVLRPAAAIEWATAPNGTGFWLVSDYKLGRKILGDRRFLRSEAAGPKAPKISTYNAAPDAIISLEGREHARVRGLVTRAFTERKIAGLEPFVARWTTDLLDELETQSAPVDFVSHVSAKLPFGVLCHLLGIPEADRQVFGSWVNVLFRLHGDSADSRQHSISLARYMMRLVAAKRREPTSDLISDLIRSADREGVITDRELVTLCLSLLMAGYDSTVDQITLCVLTIILNRSLLARLNHNPELIPRAVEELLRLNPAPYITFPRMTVKPVSIGGTLIQPGQLVVVFIMSSNRDPAIFADAEGVTLEHPVSPHLTFGHGLHRCLGAPLARLQLTTLLADLVRRFPDLSLAADIDSLSWKAGMATRGLSEMLVTW